MAYRLRLILGAERPRLAVVRVLSVRTAPVSRIFALPPYTGRVNLCAMCGGGFAQGEVLWIREGDGAVFHASRREASAVRAEIARLVSCRSAYERAHGAAARAHLRRYAGRRAPHLRALARRTTFYE